MSRILRVSESDYKIQVQPGGLITLDTGATTINANDIVVGYIYTIISAGDTDFVLLGAPDNNPGTVFTATSAPTVSGSGTVAQVGTVRVLGNLDVTGVTTTVNTVNMAIEDNIIVLNRGESDAVDSNGAPRTINAGISEGVSGLQVDRGSLIDAYLLFDESVQWYNPTTGLNVDGTWVFKGGTDTSTTTGIQVASISTNGTTNLVFDLQNSTRVIEIANSGSVGSSPEAQAIAYANRLLYPSVPEAETLNWVPNKKFINMYIQSGVVTPGMADVDKIYRTYQGSEMSRVQAEDDGVHVVIAEEETCTFSSNGLTFRNNIVIDRNTINNISTSNLLITASADVEVDAVLNLDNQVGSPVAIEEATKIYSSATAGAGKTGIYFTNKRTGEPGQAINETVSDELIAKNRALLFSMIF